MKRKTREEKAITLIALIITIVVLLILAVVAINAVTGDGIIQHATNARTNYENAQDKEEGLLSYYQTYLDAQGQVGKWVQDGSTIKRLNEDGSIDSLKIGDIVNYDNNTGKVHLTDENKTGIADTQEFKANSYNSGWKVLGVENDCILLVSADAIKTETGNTFTIFNGNMYLYGEELLNDICAIYKNETYAESARSIIIEDVNKITGYNPYGKSTNGFSYGDIVEYESDGTNIKFRVNGGSSEQIYLSIDDNGNKELFNGINNFFYIKDNEWQTALTSGNSLKVTMDIYTYWGATGDDFWSQGMSTDSEEYKLIFRNKENSDNLNYWVASKIIQVDLSRTRYVFHGLRHVTKGAVSNSQMSGPGAGSDGTNFSRGVRPVVILKSNVKLEYDATNKVWNIN